MSWNGTVTCGYCGASGHNKRGCPQLKADIERRRSMFGEDDWKVREHEYHRQRTSRKGEKRSCTYCGEMGHNRRTCVTLSDHVGKMVAASKVWRRQLVAALETSGVGVGSLLVQTDWRERKTRYVVTGIDWERACYLTYGRVLFLGRDLSNLTQPERVVSAPAGVGFDHILHTYRGVEVVSAKAGFTVPDGWVDEGISVKTAKANLKEVESWQWEKSPLGRTVTSLLNAAEVSS